MNWLFCRVMAFFKKLVYFVVLSSIVGFSSQVSGEIKFWLCDNQYSNDFPAIRYEEDDPLCAGESSSSFLRRLLKCIYCTCCLVFLPYMSLFYRVNLACINVTTQEFPDNQT